MALGLWRKDIETIAAFAADVQCPVPLFAAAAQPYYAALAQGLGDLDTAAVCAVLGGGGARGAGVPRRSQAPPRIVRRNRSMQEMTNIKNGIRVPFDAAHLDALMEEAGLDVLLATSKHNIQYLLGGYRYFFFERMDAIGQSRYLPILIYPRGRPEKAAYFGNAMESFEHELTPHWTPEVQLRYWGSLDTMAAAIAYLRKIGASASADRHRNRVHAGRRL